MYSKNEIKTTIQTRPIRIGKNIKNLLLCKINRQSDIQTDGWTDEETRKYNILQKFGYYRTASAEMENTDNISYK